MDFRKLQNTDRSDIPYFEVTEKDAILRKETRQDEYRRYRAKYKAARGVFPELDRINNPVVAICTDEAFWPQDAAKGALKSIGKMYGSAMKGAFKLGFALMGAGGGSEGASDLIEGLGHGIGQNPELLLEFTRRFKSIVEPHKYIYGLACNPDCLPDIDNLYPRERIVDNLGYRFDEENGIYYEGTWQDGELVYGMILPLRVGMIFMGDVRNGVISEGVIRSSDSVDCGVMGENGLECQEGFSYVGSAIFLGPFTEGELNGMAIGVICESGACKKQEYVMGKAKTGIAGFIGRQKASMETHKNTVNNIFGKFKK